MGVMHAVRSLLVMLAVLFSSVAWAVCPKQTATLCEQVRESDWVVRGVVESVQAVSDDDDAEGIAGWLYHLNILATYRGVAKSFLIVFSSNSTSRVLLEKGGDYFVFITKMPGELLETSNQCDSYSEAKYEKNIEEQILKCVH